MQITVSAERYNAELVKWLTERVAEKRQAVVDGVATFELYRERCAEIRMLNSVLEQLPKLLRKAKE